MSTAVLLQKLTAGGFAVEQNMNFTGDLVTHVEASVPESSTDYVVSFAADVDKIQAIIILSDQDMVLETNSGAAPDDTINLLADNPYTWYLASYYTNKLTVDVTALYATTGVVGISTLKILMIMDATPA